MPLLRRKSEKAEQAAIVSLVPKLGGQVWVLGHPSPNDGRTHRGTGQTAGVPDLWIVLPAQQGLRPLAFWWEVKSSVGKLSIPQMLFAERSNAAGVSCHVGTLDVFISYMRQMGYVKAEA